MSDSSSATTIPKEVGYTSHELNTPRPVGIDRLADLRGDKWFDTVREMVEQDSTIGAVLYAVEMMMRTVTWRVDPADKSPQAIEWATFVDECIEDVEGTWPDFIAEILSFVQYGYSLFEVVYKRRLGWSEDPTTRSAYDDGKTGWRKFAYRPQETSAGWERKDGEIVGWKQRKPGGSSEVIIIPLEKCLHFVTTARYGSPEGVSLLKRAFLPWYFKKEIQNSEAIGVQRDLAGLLVVTVPGAILNLTSEDPKVVQARQGFEKMVRNVHRGSQEGIMLPSDLWEGTDEPQYSAKLMASGGAKATNTDALVSRYRTDMAMVLLADFILLGHSTTGTYTAGVSKAKVFVQALSAWLDAIRDELNESAIKPLMRLNGAPEEFWPTIEHDDPESQDLTVLGTFVKALHDVGAYHDSPEVSRILMDLAGLPGPPEEEDDDQAEEEEDIIEITPGVDPLALPPGTPAATTPAPAAPGGD